nr:type II and III secretion system protein [Methylomonas sp. SURF-2]
MGAPRPANAAQGGPAAGRGNRCGPGIKALFARLSPALPVGLGLLLLLASANADESLLEIITLQNRPAAEVQALLAPLLETNEAVNSDGFNLIVKSSPDRMDSIRKLIAQLDSRRRNLLISVLQNSHKTAEQLNAEAAIALSPDSLRMRGMAGDTRNIDRRNTLQTLRALEGQAAHIQAGDIKAFDNIGIYGDPYGYTGITSNTYLREASTGFAVIPRLTDNDEVIIDITPWSERFTQNRGMESRHLQTTLRARLGEWLEIGGVSEQRQTDRQGFKGFNYSTRKRDQGILIKIDLAE